MNIASIEERLFCFILHRKTGSYREETEISVTFQYQFASLLTEIKHISSAIAPMRSISLTINTTNTKPGAIEVSPQSHTPLKDPEAEMTTTSNIAANLHHTTVTNQHWLRSSSAFQSTPMLHNNGPAPGFVKS